MRSVGYVAKVRADVAEVLLGKHAQCSGCGACIAAADDRARRLEATNEIGAAEGAKVEIEIPPGRLIRAAFLMFILPVFVALAAGYAGYRVAIPLGVKPALMAVGLGCLAFAGSFLVLKAAERAGAGSGLPRIVRILHEGETEGRC